MRASQGMPFGAKAIAYHPELFKKNEEVILFERNEFKRTFTTIHEYLNDIFLKDYSLWGDINSDSLAGYWPWIMERIHIINLSLELFLVESPCQSYLDTYIHNPVKASEEELVESLSIHTEKVLGLDWL